MNLQERQKSWYSIKINDSIREGRGLKSMTEKDLKKLNRYQLLEMLIIQTERADDLQRRLDAAQAQLDSRDVQMTVVGSIAEASLQLSGVFEAAQNAADLYMNAVRERCAMMEAEAVRRAEEILEEANRKVWKIQDNAEMEQL